jgi:hypothetical protein
VCAALVEALMGFQFNHVGGGTKTRRPITLHMKYNSACVQPNCFLVTEDYGEQEVTLEELQVSSTPSAWPQDVCAAARYTSVSQPLYETGSAKHRASTAQLG